MPVRTVERKVTTLIPVFLPGDSAVLRAWFECDSANNVLLRDIEERKSKNMASSISFRNGILEYGAETKPDTVYIPSDTIFIEKEIPVPVEVEKEINLLTRWQRVRIWIGDIMITILAAFAVWKLVKLYLNFKKL
jgi:hypothetical protein